MTQAAYSDTFIQCMEHLLDPRIEGGYVNDKNDPGKETKYGISKTSFPTLDIKNLTRDDAYNIYHLNYWESWMELQPLLAYHLFSAAVNSGKGQMILWLQRALKVADDGIWGPISLEAFRRADPFVCFLQFEANRLNFYTSLSNWKYHGKGWANRIAQEMRFAADDFSKESI